MTYPTLSTCPVCNQTLTIKKLACHHCHTTIENDFALSRFAMFTDDDLAFIETFMLSRGNIKEVEKALGVSYPTVRNKLNDIIERLGHDTSTHEHENDDTSTVLSMLEAGDMDAEEAVNTLKQKGRKP